MSKLTSRTMRRYDEKYGPPKTFWQRLLYKLKIIVIFVVAFICGAAIVSGIAWVVRSGGDEKPPVSQAQPVKSEEKGRPAKAEEAGPAPDCAYAFNCKMPANYQVTVPKGGTVTDELIHQFEKNPGTFKVDIQEHVKYLIDDAKKRLVGWDPWLARDGYSMYLVNYGMMLVPDPVHDSAHFVDQLKKNLGEAKTANDYHMAYWNTGCTVQKELVGSPQDTIVSQIGMDTLVQYSDDAEKFFGDDLKKAAPRYGIDPDLFYDRETKFVGDYWSTHKLYC